MTAHDNDLQGRIAAALARWQDARTNAQAAESLGDTQAARMWTEQAQRRHESLHCLMSQQQMPVGAGR